MGNNLLLILSDEYCLGGLSPSRLYMERYMNLETRLTFGAARPKVPVTFAFSAPLPEAGEEIHAERIFLSSDWASVSMAAV